MTDSNIKPEPIDIDHDRDGLSLHHDAAGRLTAHDGGRVWTSVDQGRTWAPVNADCDGLPADWSWLPKVVGEMAALCVRVEDVCKPLDEVRRAAGVRIDGPNFRTVEVQDGKGQRVGKIWASTTMPRTPIARPSSIVVDDLEVPAIRLDGIDLGATGTHAGRGQRARAVPFTDTPGPDGMGKKSGIMIEVPVEGWPSGWFESCYPGYRIRARKWSDESSACARLPNTERGRRAAWAMEKE